MTTSNEIASKQATPPHAGILQILNGAYVAGAVSCLAQLGIPDLLKNGPEAAEALASQIGDTEMAKAKEFLGQKLAAHA